MSVIFFFEFTNQVLNKISLLNVIQVKKEKKKYTEAQVCGWMCLLRTQRVLMWFSCFWCFRTVQKNILDQGEVERSSSAPDVSGWQLQPDWLWGIFPHSEAQLLEPRPLQWAPRRSGSLLLQPSWVPPGRGLGGSGCRGPGLGVGGLGGSRLREQ